MAGALVFRGAKHTLSTYFPSGYTETLFMFFLDLFIMFNGGGGGGHFECDLYTMCDRKTR